MPIEKRKAAVTILLAVFAILMEWFYVEYMFNHGLEDKTVTVVQVTIPLAAMPAMSVLFVFLACWNCAGGSILPGRSRPELRERDLSVRLRVTKVASILAAVFLSVLFLPYALWSCWFWGYLGGIAALVPQTRHILSGLYDGTVVVWRMNALWKYVASQNLAALVTAIVAIIYVQRRPRIRKVK
jgi:hypothetical protein